MQQLILAACVLGALPRAGSASPIPTREQSLTQLARASARIFVGTVSQLHYRPDSRTGLIHTHVRFRAVTVLKGSPPRNAGPGEWALRVAGGRDTDGTLVRVAGVPEFRVGERYLVFERAGAWPFCSLAGWDQGCYHLIRRPASRDWAVLDASDTPVLGLEDGWVRRGRPRFVQDPQSLFGASVPRRVGSNPSVDAPFDPSPSVGAADVRTAPERQRGPAILRVTGAERWRDGRNGPLPSELIRAMPAREFLSTVRQICLGSRSAH